MSTKTETKSSRSATLSPGGPTNCKLTGGTGKFDGLQADLAITVRQLKSNYEGVDQMIGQKKGTYKIVKTN